MFGLNLSNRPTKFAKNRTISFNSKTPNNSRHSDYITFTYLSRTPLVEAAVRSVLRVSNDYAINRAVILTSEMMEELMGQLNLDSGLRAAAPKLEGRVANLQVVKKA